MAIQAPDAGCLRSAHPDDRGFAQDPCGCGSFRLSICHSRARRGIESRSGGAGGDHTIVFTFANNVVSGGATVISGTGSVAGSPTFSANTMTVNLTGVTDAQTLGVKFSGVTDVFSQVLADTTLNAGFLFGDTNGDGTVNARRHPPDAQSRRANDRLHQFPLRCERGRIGQ